MKTILVATDFSSPANNAVDYAAHLAQKTGAELILFNAYTMSVHANNSHSSSAVFKKLMKEDEDRLIETAQKLKESFPITVKSVFMTDGTIPSLKKYLKVQTVDLVVMGIESNLTEYKLFGNTTTDAIKMRQFPLLVVPNDIKFDGYNNILYACDPSHISSTTNINALKDLVSAYNAELDVLHVLTDNNDAKKDEALEVKMESILQGVNHAYKYIQNTNVGEGIKEGLDAYPAELLVMIPHKIGFFESLLKGSQTSQMTIKTRVPLLVIPNDLVN